MSDWQSIETAPKTDGEYILGFDAVTAELWNAREAGLCLLQWIEADEDDEWEAGWQVMPFSEGLDCVLSDTSPTHWMPLPKPPVSA